eukprot:68458_1
MSQLIIVATLFTLSLADQVLVAGDSWGEKGHPFLQNVLASHNNTKDLKVKSYAVGGTTTSDWISPPTKLLDIVNENPDAEYLWLTLGGNDAADYMPKCTRRHPYPDETCINNIVSIMVNNTMIMLDPVLKQYPHLQVVQFGYDILNFQKDICSFYGSDLIHGCDDTPSCINPQFIKLQTDFIPAVKQIFGRNYNGIDLLGTLQMNDPKHRYPNVTVGNPDLDAWSPRELIQDNCIHPTEPQGFTDVFEEMYNVYWRHVRG